MSRRYLKERQRTIEVIVALYAFSYATFVSLVIIATDRSPLRWAQLSDDTQLWLAGYMMSAGLLLASGIRINGLWRWSPVLRLIGLVPQLLVVVYVMRHTQVTGAAFLNYCFFASLLAYSVVVAARDVGKAVRRGQGTP